MNNASDRMGSSLGVLGWTECFLPLKSSPHFGSFFRLWVQQHGQLLRLQGKRVPEEEEKLPSPHARALPWEELLLHPSEVSGKVHL